MSRRRASRDTPDPSTSSTTPTCRCGKPTPPGAYLCADDRRTLHTGLQRITEHHADLETLRTGQTRYGTGNGGRSTTRPAGMNLLFDVDGPGTQAERDTLDTLRTWTGRTLYAYPWLDHPADTVPAMTQFLRSNLHALIGHDNAPDLADDVYRLEQQLRQLVDRPADLVFAGLCPVCAVVGQRSSMYAAKGQTIATCRAPDCDNTVDLAGQRKAMNDELHDRLCTPAEIARLATYLGLDVDRDAVRKRIHYWHRHGRITAASRTEEGEPMFPYGEVRDLLYEDHATRQRRGA